MKTGKHKDMEKAKENALDTYGLRAQGLNKK